MKTTALFFLCILLFSGCSLEKVSPLPSKKHTLILSKPTPQEELPLYRLQETTPIKEALYEEYKKWYGVKYCYGGIDKNGVDCSALVQIIYYDAFGIKVPRTTALQAQVGYPIKKSLIQEGDLVLFKTGWRTRHSGIYLEHGNFLHTSTKHGVTISNLNNPYWRSKYWQTRRVLAR